MSPARAGAGTGTMTLGLLARALGRVVTPGETVDLPLDLAVLGGAAGPETVQLFEREGARPWDSSRVALTFDFPAPGVELRIPRSRTLCRDFAARHSLRHVHDINLGVGSHVLMELGAVAPGRIVAGSGRCLHLLGAMGALVFGAEPGPLAQAIRTGRLTLQTPPVAEVRFDGAPVDGFGAFDMALAALRALPALSAGTVLEFTGRPVESLSMDGRVTLVDVGAEAFRAGVVAPDQITAAFLSERMETPPPPAAAGGSAGSYASVVPVALDGARPLIQGPGPGGPIRPVSELAGLKIHSAFIGSCAAGRYSDLLVAAGILRRARRIHPDVRLTVSPATLEVARGCLASGLYELFMQVGAMLGVPGSSPGMASGGALFGEGEVIISTSPCSSPQTDAGRGPEVYRAGPATVAAAAAAGEIRDPGSL